MARLFPVPQIAVDNIGSNRGERKAPASKKRSISYRLRLCITLWITLWIKPVLIGYELGIKYGVGITSYAIAINRCFYPQDIHVSYRGYPPFYAPIETGLNGPLLDARDFRR